MSEIADASARRGKRRAPPTLTQARNPRNRLLKRDKRNGNLKLWAYMIDSAGVVLAEGLFRGRAYQTAMRQNPF